MLPSSSRIMLLLVVGTFIKMVVVVVGIIVGTIIIMTMIAIGCTMELDHTNMINNCRVVSFTLTVRYI
jgi:hypothetical protein